MLLCGPMSILCSVNALLLTTYTNLVALIYKHTNGLFLETIKTLPAFLQRVCWEWADTATNPYRQRLSGQSAGWWLWSSLHRGTTSHPSLPAAGRLVYTAGTFCHLNGERVAAIDFIYTNLFEIAIPCAVHAFDCYHVSWFSDEQMRKLNAFSDLPGFPL